MDYEKGFIDGYYQANSFNENINPCKLIKKVNCYENDTFKDCQVKQSKRNTSCSIHYLGQKLNYLVNKGTK